jgi:4-hydroxybenzoyl-CoA thioesterase
MCYRTKLPVRFGDVDKAGIVYYPVIFHYLHVAQEDFFADFVGVPYHQLIEHENIGFPTVKASTEFIKPLKYGDLLEISVHVSRTGNSSATFEFNIYRDGTNELLARSSEVKVAVNMSTWEKIDIPQRYREKFSQCRELE